MGKKKYEQPPARKVITMFGTNEMIEKINAYFNKHPNIVKGYEYTDMIIEGIDKRELEELR
jgi:hypothetical protein